MVSILCAVGTDLFACSNAQRCIEVLGWISKLFRWDCAELPYLSCVTARPKARLRAPAASCR